MMASLEKWLRIGVPAGWNDVLVRTVKVAVVAILALVLKEWMETREWDVPTCAIDGAWVAGGAFALNAILLGLSGFKTHGPPPR